MAAGRDIRAGRAFVEVFLKDKLSGGLEALERRAAAVGAAFTKIGTLVGGVGAAIGGAFLGATKMFITLGDALDKTSLRTGVAVESLSVLGYAAGQTGASLETLEKGFFGLSRTLNDAERGSATAADALERIGLTIKDLKGLNPDEQFKRVADGLAKLTDESTRGAVAQEIFGRAGRQLIPMLKDGRAGMEALQREAESLGIVMSTDQAQAAAQLGDAWDRIMQQFKAVTTQIGAALAPALLDLGKNITPLLKNVIDWTRENAALVGATFKVAAALAFAGTAAIAFGAALKAAAVARAALLALSGPAGWALLAVGLGAAAAAAYTLNSAMSDTAATAASTAAEVRGAADAAEDFAEKAGGGENELRAMLATVNEFAERMRYLKSLQDTGLALGPALEAREGQAFKGDFLDKLRKFQEASKAAKRPVDELQAALAKLQAQAAEGLLPDRLADDIGAMLETEIGKKSGIAEALKAARQELDLMAGRVSEIDLKLGDFLANGALPSQAAELRGLLDKIEAAKQRDAAQRQADLAKDRENAGLDALAKSIKQETRTPEEIFADRLKELESVRDRLPGDILARAQAQAQAALQEALKPAQAGAAAASEFAFNRGSSLRSTEGVHAVANVLRGSTLSGQETEAQRHRKKLEAQGQARLEVLREIARQAANRPKIFDAPIG